MSAVAMELDAMLTTLGAESAKRLEATVRAEISKAEVEKQEWEEAMARLRERKPHLWESIGAFDDIDFQRPAQGELSPARL